MSVKHLFIPFQLTSYQTHTMAPVRQLVYGYLASLLSTENKKSKNSHRDQDQPIDGNVSDSDDSQSEESSEMNKNILERKDWSRREIMVSTSAKKEKENTNIMLKKLFKDCANFKL